MRPIATSYDQAAYHFEQGAACVRCMHGEDVQDCYRVKDAHAFFARYDRTGTILLLWLMLVAAVMWVLIAFWAGSL